MQERLSIEGGWRNFCSIGMDGVENVFENQDRDFKRLDWEPYDARKLAN